MAIAVRQAYSQVFPRQSRDFVTILTEVSRPTTLPLKPETLGEAGRAVETSANSSVAAHLSFFLGGRCLVQGFWMRLGFSKEEWWNSEKQTERTIRMISPAQSHP